MQVGAVKVEVKTMYFTPYNNGACQKDLAISVPYLDPNGGYAMGLLWVAGRHL